MPLIVDSHNDIAWNMLVFQRDYTRSVAETRRLEAGTAIREFCQDSLIGWPEYQRGEVAVVFATLFAPPMRSVLHEIERPYGYRTPQEAHRLYREQLFFYQRLIDSNPDKFRLVTTVPELEEVLALWQARSSPPEGPNSAPDDRGGAVGLVPLMEGADAIRTTAELEEWFELGLRLIGPAWIGTRYSGGWKEPGPLTEEGRSLLHAMADFNFILDVSHMDEPAVLEALDIYSGPIAATHGNCLALLPGFPNNRHFSDRVLHGVIDRDGVVGVVPYNGYLKVGWLDATGRREEVPLSVLVDHIDHICQLAGDSLHAGIGSDFDGGFGLQSVPPEIDSIADLQKVGPLLLERGYTQADVANILGGNWLARLKRELPS